MRLEFNIKSWGLLYFFGIVAVLFPDIAMAAIGPDSTLGDVADQVMNKDKGGVFRSTLDIMSGLAYIAGAFFGVRAAIQLKEHTDSPQQIKLSKPTMSAAVAAFSLGLPSFMHSMVDSLGVKDCADGDKGSKFGGCMSDVLAGMDPAKGGSAQDLSQMAQSFASSVPWLMQFVILGAVMAGGFLILRAIFMLPQVEQGRVETQKVLWMLLSGVIMWSILPMLDVALNTQGIGTNSSGNILVSKYTGGGESEQFDATIASVLKFVQFIGLVAFARGALILKAIGDHKDGSMGRALTHILAGAMAVNIGLTVSILATTIGAHEVVCDKVLKGFCVGL